MMAMKKILYCILILSLLCVGCTNSDIHVVDIDGDGKLTCSLEIRCDTLLGNLDKMSEGKAALVPIDGCLLEKTEIVFTAGDSVFDVFRRVLRENNIHFEYVDARLYGSVYIEGIGNLYEFDCGPQSGWMFSVNGIYPGLGCSKYTLADRDIIVFNYTCNLGEDLGVQLEE